MRFEGRVALVTGGANGIGAATSELFAREGASVVVIDPEHRRAQDLAKVIADRGGKAIAVGCDVTQRSEADAAVRKLIDTYGRLDILVCCAGITRDNLIYKMTDNDWYAVISTHLSGTFFFARGAQAVMVKQQYGTMVFLSSLSASGNRGQTNYSTAKAGLQAMARTLSIELGRYSINVNAVAPGFVETRMTEATARRLGVEFEEFKKANLNQIPRRILGQPHHIASVIAFLCSDDAESITGQTIYATGGPVGSNILRWAGASP